VGASDRLREIASQVHDIETREERVHSLLACSREENDALRRASSELVEAIEDARLGGAMPALPDSVAAAVAGLSAVASR
jgi:hypothetical protein